MARRDICECECNCDGCIKWSDLGMIIAGLGMSFAFFASYYWGIPLFEKDKVTGSLFMIFSTLVTFGLAWWIGKK